MGKQTGFVVERNGKLYIGVTYIDDLGKKRELMRRANDRKHSRQLQKELVKKLDSDDGRADIDAEKTTFAKVADVCVAWFAIAAFTKPRVVAHNMSLHST
jgi:hypothetical protein